MDRQVGGGSYKYRRCRWRGREVWEGNGRTKVLISMLGVDSSEDQKVKGVSNYPANSDTTNGKHTYADVVLKKKE